MALILDPACYLGLLACPCPKAGALESAPGGARCVECGKAYAIEAGVLRLVEAGELDAATLRELKAHSYDLTQERIASFANKDRWSSYYSHFSDRKIDALLGYLDGTGCDEFFSLGVGTGFELKKLLSRRRFKAIYASDLSWSALSIVPHTLSGLDASVGLFTSDLDRCPVRPLRLPVVIYEALHHTSDMHATIGRLLSRGYGDILFVEPSTNFLVGVLSRLGLAERREYSGLKPKWLDLGKLRRLCREHGYEASVTTMWEVPEEYFRKLWKRGGAVQKGFLALVDGISGLSGLFKVGSFAIVHLRKKGR